MKAQKRSRRLAVLSLWLYSLTSMTSMVDGGQRHAPTPLPSCKRPGAPFTGGREVPRAVWMSAENLVTTRIRSPVRPGHSQSLYHYAILAHLLEGKNRSLEVTQKVFLTYTMESPY